jgi:chemotaxis regulatin CheY-phosphate phosphatase CheZ
VKELHESINELVVQLVTTSIITGKKINVPDVVSEMMQSLADMILEQPVEEQRKLVEHARDRLDYWLRRKTTH